MYLCLQIPATTERLCKKPITLSKAIQFTTLVYVWHSNDAITRIELSMGIILHQDMFLLVMFIKILYKTIIFCQKLLKQ